MRQMWISLNEEWSQSTTKLWFDSNPKLYKVNIELAIDFEIVVFKPLNVIHNFNNNIFGRRLLDRPKCRKNLTAHSEIFASWKDVELTKALLITLEKKIFRHLYLNVIDKHLEIFMHYKMFTFYFIEKFNKRDTYKKVSLSPAFTLHSESNSVKARIYSFFSRFSRVLAKSNCFDHFLELSVNNLNRIFRVFIKNIPLCVALQAGLNMKRERNFSIDKLKPSGTPFFMGQNQHFQQKIQAKMVIWV